MSVLPSRGKIFDVMSPSVWFGIPLNATGVVRVEISKIMLRGSLGQSANQSKNIRLAFACEPRKANVAAKAPYAVYCPAELQIAAHVPLSYFLGRS